MKELMTLKLDFDIQNTKEGQGHLVDSLWRFYCCIGELKQDLPSPLLMQPEESGSQNLPKKKENNTL